VNEEYDKNMYNGWGGGILHPILPKPFDIFSKDAEQLLAGLDTSILNVCMPKAKPIHGPKTPYWVSSASGSRAGLDYDPYYYNKFKRVSRSPQHHSSILLP